MKRRKNHFFRPSRGIFVALLSMLYLGGRVVAQSQSRPDVANSAATFGQQPPVIPAGATRGPVPAALEKRLEIMRKLRPNPDRQATPGGDPRAAYETQVFGRAKTLLRNNDAAGAEELIGGMSQFESGSMLWHLDTGSRLRVLCDEVSKDGDLKHVSDLVARSLRHFDEAFARARDDGDQPGQAAAKVNAAFLHERYSGDLASAVAAYRAALQAKPDDAPAREGLVRLEQSLAIFEERVRARNN
jgi:hypothetical protein